MAPSVLRSLNHSSGIFATSLSLGFLRKDFSKVTNVTRCELLPGVSANEGAVFVAEGGGLGLANVPDVAAEPFGKLLGGDRASC